MDLTECMEILFSLFGGFACFRLCLKIALRIYTDFSPINCINLTNIYCCVIVFLLRNYIDAIWRYIAFWMGSERVEG